jgi:hypothetical protein
MRKINAVLIAFIAMSFCCGVGLAQEKAKDGSAQGSADAQAAKDEIQPFRLDFSFNEIEDGKKVNTRHYSTDLTEESGNQVVKIGTRVPVAVSGPSGDYKNVQYQYIDVGTTINSGLRKVGGDLRLHVDSEISNLDTTDEPSKIAPIVRQIKIEGTTLLVLGKPILIGTADDPNSKRQFQLEVTATRLR